jgi:menaquinone-dependent protoporphyrinogen oxidase
MSIESEKQRGMNRREFLVVSCGASLALLLRRGIAGAAGGQASQEFIESTCPKDVSATKRVLIAYASKCGSTGSVAEAMGEALCAMGAAVDVRLVEKVKDLSPYQAVMVGSAIRRGQWLSEATAFVKNNQDALSRLPTAYFVVCLTMKDDTPETRAKVLAYLDPVQKGAPRIKPTAVGLFPGVVDFGKLSFVNKSVLEAKGISEGDYRNWPAVKGWVSDVGPSLVAAQPRG